MTTYDLRLATLGDVPAITGLIDRAAQWLRTKDTDQWARPWPDRDARDKRVTQGVTRGDTWMLETSGAPAGTVTYRKEGNEILWRPGELSEPAVYVSRLIIDRAFSGRGIGGILIDWAGLRGASEWQASSIRIDVWTDNHGLHAYYTRQGFDYLPTCDFKDYWEYPSAALFQKPAGAIDSAAAARFSVKSSSLSTMKSSWLETLPALAR